jgi:hypothetical protein
MNAAPERRFPAPWSVEELDACFLVIDNGGQKLAHVYFEDEPWPALCSQATHEGRGAADRGEYRQAAGAKREQNGNAGSVVRFRGNSGPCADVLQRLLLTQSGHQTAFGFGAFCHTLRQLARASFSSRW